MARSAADEFEGEAAESSIAELDKSLKAAVTGPCQDIISGRYPFSGGVASDVPLADFARLFAPNGIIDRYFAQNLGSLVDMSGKSWAWRADTRLGRSLSRATLGQFQMAAEIRDAFFPSGDAAPSVKLTVEPSSLNSDVDMALLSVDGQVLQAYPNGSGGGTLNWPGSGVAGSASLSLTPALPGRQSSISFNGPWALKRLMDQASPGPNGDAPAARFVIGGQGRRLHDQDGVRRQPLLPSGALPFHLPEPASNDRRAGGRMPSRPVRHMV